MVNIRVTVLGKIPKKDEVVSYLKTSERNQIQTGIELSFFF